MKTLVLGGSVFVGKHTVEALLAEGHDVAVLNRGRTPTDLPGRRRAAGGRPHRHRPAAGRARRSRLGRRVRRLRVRHGRRRVGHRGPARPARRPCRPLRLRQLDHGLRPVAGRDLPVDRGPADQPRRADQLRRVQGGRRGRDAGPPRGDRLPGDDRPPGGDLRAGQQHLRHGTADVPAPARVTGRSWSPTAASSSARTVTSTTCARRWCRWSATRRPSARCSTSPASRSPSTATSRCSPTSSASSPTSCYVPDAMLGELPGPVFGHLFGVRHHAMASIEKAQRAARLHVPLRPAIRPRGHLRVVPGQGVRRRRRADGRPDVAGVVGLRRRGGGRRAGARCMSRPTPRCGGRWRRPSATCCCRRSPTTGRG